MPGRRSTNAAESALAAHALAYPETHEDNPWEHRAFKVRRKTFLFTNLENGVLGLSVKLPRSLESALSLPFTSPTGHGLGKSGWVSARFEPGDEIPVGLLKSWVDESFRAIAPKKLIQSVDSGGTGTWNARSRKVIGKTRKMR